MIMNPKETWTHYDERLRLSVTTMLTAMMFMPSAKWYHRIFSSRHLSSWTNMLLNFKSFETRNPTHGLVELFHSEYKRVCGKAWSRAELKRQIS